MNKLDDQLRNAIDNSTAPPSSNTAKEMSKNVDELLNAAKKGDQNATDKLNDKIANDFQELKDQIVNDNKNTSDPIRKRRMADAIDNLEELIPLQSQTAKQLSKDPKKMKNCWKN